MSSSQSAELVLQARQQGVDVIGESCPQYLLAHDDLLRGEHGHWFATCPPLRSKQCMQELRSHLGSGGIQILGTDTCTFNSEQKDSWGGDYRKMAFGLHGIDVLLPLSYHLGVQLGQFDLQRWVQLVAENPARIHGLFPRKGALLPGADADVVIFDPNAQKTLQPETMATRADFSPYSGMQIQGWPRTVLRRGSVLVENEEFLDHSDRGIYLHRKI